MARTKTWADFATEKITWAWENWLPNGFLTIIMGDQGIGKSFLALRIAQSFTTGKEWPDGKEFGGEPKKVFWIDTESSRSLNIDRSNNWGLPLNWFVVPEDSVGLVIWKEQATEGQNRRIEITKTEIEETFARQDVGIMVIDTLRGFFDGNENSSETFKVSAWLSSLAHKYNKPIIAIHHARKPSFPGRRELTHNDGRGSSALIQTARMIWSIQKKTAGLTIRRVKNNIGVGQDTLFLSITEDGMKGSCETTCAGVEDLKASRFLSEVLKDGPRKVNEVKAAARQNGISKRGLNQAKEDLKVKSEKISLPGHGRGKGGYWQWALPPEPTVTDN